MQTYILSALVFLLSLPFAAHSQQQSPAPSTSPTPAPAEARQDADINKDSTIVFFRESHYVGSALKPSIYLDGKDLDRLENGRWFSVHAAPGKHELQSSAKNQPATLIETKAGETTYVQMVIVSGNWRGGGRLMEVDSEGAKKILAKLKPLHQ
ncbi:MAG: DUF2846 domain-containing protein [Candidatus Acidiferrum sp.]